MRRNDKTMSGSTPTKLQVRDADGNVIADITSLNGFMKFRRAWAAVHKIKTKNVALAVACEGGLYHLLDSKPAFREFAAGENDGVRACHVVNCVPLPESAPQDLRDDQEAYDCWRRAA